MKHPSQMPESWGYPRRQRSPEDKAVMEAQAAASLAVLKAMKAARTPEDEAELANVSLDEPITAGAGARFEAYNAMLDAQRLNAEEGGDTEREAA